MCEGSHIPSGREAIGRAQRRLDAIADRDQAAAVEANVYDQDGGLFGPDENRDRGDNRRRYALTGPHGIDPFLDNLSPHADHHTITVYGSADLARRLVEADKLGVCVAWRQLGDEAEQVAAADDDTDEV